MERYFTWPQNIGCKSDIYNGFLGLLTIWPQMRHQLSPRLYSRAISNCVFATRSPAIYRKQGVVHHPHSGSRSTKHNHRLVDSLPIKTSLRCLLTVIGPPDSKSIVDGLGHAFLGANAGLRIYELHESAPGLWKDVLLTKPKHNIHLHHIS